MYRLPRTRPVRASIVRRKISRRRRASPVTTQCDPRESTFRTRRRPLRSAMRIASRRSTRRDLRSMRTPSRSMVRLCANAAGAVGRPVSQVHKITRATIKRGAIFITPPIAYRSRSLQLTLMLKTDWWQLKMEIAGGATVTACLPANTMKLQNNYSLQ